MGNESRNGRTPRNKQWCHNNGIPTEFTESGYEVDDLARLAEEFPGLYDQKRIAKIRNERAQRKIGRGR